MERKIRVLLADDHVILREGIRQFLEDVDDIEVVGEADDGAGALHLVQKLMPDVVVLDIRMPVISGVEAARRIKIQHPEVKVLILTAYDDDPYVFALLQAGADGYIMKTSRAEELIRAVRDVYAGNKALSPEIATKVIQQITQRGPSSGGSQIEVLTRREIDVIRLAAQGKTNREIGQELHISHRTVQGHLANIYTKLDVNSRTEAVTEALKRGWIVID